MERTGSGAEAGATLLGQRAHPERLRDRPFDAAATSDDVPEPPADGRARCQCLTDEQPKSGLPLEALESASRARRGDTRRRVRWSTCKGLRCRECGREYDGRADLHVRVVLRPARGRVRLRRDRRARSSREKIAAGPAVSLWRYADLLPVAADAAVDLGTGFTPLVRADRLAAELGLGEVWVKNDTRNPTNSFKDRVVSVALSKALEFGFKVAACASTGNLANSVAAHAAHAGLRSYVFIPSNLEQGKIVTTAVYGGNVVAIDGNYDDVNRLCAELAGIYEWAFVNVNMRPFYAEGSKTLAFETAEQLGWQTPDHVVVPVASGSLLTKIQQGLRGAAQGRPARRGAAGARVGRAGARLLAGRDGVHRGVRHDPAGEARHDRQVARDRQPGRRLLRARRRCARAAAASRRSPTTRSSTACGCSPAPRGSSPRPPAA